jgi:hypothetical protein
VERRWCYEPAGSVANASTGLLTPGHATGIERLERLERLEQMSRF